METIFRGPRGCGKSTALAEAVVKHAKSTPNAKIDYVVPMQMQVDRIANLLRNQLEAGDGVSLARDRGVYHLTFPNGSTIELFAVGLGAGARVKNLFSGATVFAADDREHLPMKDLLWVYRDVKTRFFTEEDKKATLRERPELGVDYAD